LRHCQRQCPHGRPYWGRIIDHNRWLGEVHRGKRGLSRSVSDRGGKPTKIFAVEIIQAAAVDDPGMEPDARLDQMNLARQGARQVKQSGGPRYLWADATRLIYIVPPCPQT
jgi:hypothetical protein